MNTLGFTIWIMGEYLSYEEMLNFQSAIDRKVKSENGIAIPDDDYSIIRFGENEVKYSKKILGGINIEGESIWVLNTLVELIGSLPKSAKAGIGENPFEPLHFDEELYYPNNQNIQIKDLITNLSIVEKYDFGYLLE